MMSDWWNTVQGTDQTEPNEGGEDLPPAERQFVEEIGLFFESLGYSRTGGRMLGLLMLADHPLALDEIARLLLISRASVSTNARALLATGAARRVSVPGDRRDFYEIGREVWTQRLESGIHMLQALRRLTEQGLEAVAPDNEIARTRLNEQIAFLDFTLEAMRDWTEEWRRRRARLAAERDAAASSERKGGDGASHQR